MNHNIFMEDRSKLKITAVVDVEEFDEQKIVLITEEQMLIIEGAGLHIQKLSIEEGELAIEGEIDSLVYSDKNIGGRRSGGFFARMLK